MKINFLLVLFVSLALSSCSSKSDNKPPLLKYEANFNVEEIHIVEEIVKDFSKKHQLRVFEKKKENMKALNKGEDGFVMMLYHNDKPILIITNVGSPDKMLVSTFDERGFLIEELTKITMELVELLENRLNIDFDVEERRERKESVTN